MKRDRIIYVSALLLMFAACFGVYQFYFKAKLEKYAKDKEQLEKLNTVYANLNKTFKNDDPDTVVAQYKAVVESWKDAVSARVPYFNDSEWREFDKVPEDVFILQFWYGDTTRKMVLDLWEEAQKKYGAQVYQRFPADIQTMLGVAYAEQWQGYDITPKLVTDQLERLSYGISACKLLMDNNAQQIRQVRIYDPKPSGFIGNTVEYSRVGLSFVMEMRDLVAFIDKLRESDKYFSVEGMKVSHPYILLKYEPLMEVEMFLVRTRPAPEGTVAAVGAAPTTTAAFVGAFGRPGQPGSLLGGTIDDEEAPEPEPSGLGKAWKWFKRTVLVTN